MSQCNSCKQPIIGETPVKRNTYWASLPILLHARCLPDFNEGVVECQRIDADCNDCAHFRRGRMLAKGSGSCFEGHCVKFDKLVLAYPNFCSGHPCFVHRKDMQANVPPTTA